MTEIQGLKGFYDRYPDEFASWRQLIDIVEEAAREFGFREINTSSVERADLYRVKSGEELMDQMYNFEDKGGREVSLIPEQTPTRARMVQQRKDLKTPIKWFDTSKRWRYENVQKGRDREFFQTDFDIFGIESVEADTEVIACAATIFKKLGLESRVTLKISDRQIVEGYLEINDIPKVGEVMKVIDDEEKMTRDEFLEELEDLGLTQEEIRKVDDLKDNHGANLEQQLQYIENLELGGPDKSRKEALAEGSSFRERVERMQSLVSALKAHGVEDMVEIDLSVVRGLAYYTGLVFEAFDSEGELRALFGGGRYDTLVGLFGGRDVPAVGFAFGYSPTVELLKKENMWPLAEVETDVYVLSVSESVRGEALEYAKELRELGLTVETDLASRGFGDQLDYADSINAKRVLIVGERDLEKGEVTVKHMDTGEEEQLNKDKVVEHLESEGFF